MDPVVFALDVAYLAAQKEARGATDEDDLKVLTEAVEMRYRDRERRLAFMCRWIQLRQVVESGKLGLEHYNPETRWLSEAALALAAQIPLAMDQGWDPDTFAAALRRTPGSD